jgi:hypothetical protein
MKKKNTSTEGFSYRKEDNNPDSAANWQNSDGINMCQI